MMCFWNNIHQVHSYSKDRKVKIRIKLGTPNETSITAKIYPPLTTSDQPISITKTLLIAPTKNERDPPLLHR